MNEILQPRVVALLPDETLPDPDTISYYVLEKQRKLYLDGDIDENLMSIQRMIMRWNIEDKGEPQEKRQPIWLYIMSYGGDLDYMQMLLSTIESSITPVYTVNLGAAHSAAALIFLSGKKRFMTSYAKMVIHEGSAQIGGDAQKVQDQANSYKKVLAWMKEYILTRTKIPKKELMKRRTNDWELDAQYCLQNGVCDRIIETLDEVI